MKKALVTLFAVSMFAAFSVAQDHCAAETKAQGACGGCGAKASKEDEFMAEAHRMMMQADGKESCCKSTEEHPMAKGDPGCCNAKGAPAKFKVFVAGKGYQYFGCEDSAGKARSAMKAKGHRVGTVQAVTGKAVIQ